MANRPIPTPLPADLPQNWTTGQTVAPTGAEVGLSQQHGYNYQSKQINDAQAAVNLLNAAFDGLVPTTRKINGEALSGDINLTPAKVGADPAGSASAVQANLTTHVDNMVRHITADERALWNAKRPNIIRNLPIAPGNTVSAGDVVDVVGGEVQQTWQGQTNVKNLIDISSSWISVSKLNDLYSVVAYYQTGATQCRVNLINNATGANVGGILLLSGATSYITTARLSDSAFVVGRVYSNALSVILCTVSGTTITQVTSQAVSAATTDYNTLIPLSETTFISVYNRAGLKAKVCTVSGATITAGTEYSLSGSTGAAYISATRLPDAPNGDKRVCVCYSDAGDSSKGKAVIVTINASNVVSWGTPVVFASAGTRGTACIEIDGRVLVVNAPSEVAANVKYTLLMIDSSTISLLGSKTLGNYSEATVAIAKVADGGVVLYNSSVGGGGRSSKVTVVGDTLSHSSNYPFNGTASASNPSIAGIADDKVIAAYTDDGNSSYGTATLLTVKGDQIAGGFTDVSSQAIALQSGTEGQSIDVIYDGVAELTGITAGTQITSSGVQGYAPQNGWLWVRPEWEKIFGAKVENVSYIGTGVSGPTNKNTLTFSFEPSIVLITCSNSSITGNSTSTQSVVIIRGAQYAYALKDSATQLVVEWSGNTLSWHVTGTSTGPVFQFNYSGAKYCAVAIA